MKKASSLLRTDGKFYTEFPAQSGIKPPTRGVKSVSGRRQGAFSDSHSDKRKSGAGAAVRMALAWQIKSDGEAVVWSKAQDGARRAVFLSDQRPAKREGRARAISWLFFKASRAVRRYEPKPLTAVHFLHFAKRQRRRPPQQAACLASVNIKLLIALAKL